MQDVRQTILGYGPWSPDLDDHGERRCQLRGMSTAAFILVGPHDALWRALRAGETDAIAFEQAQDLVEALPSLTRRRLLSVHMAVTWPRRAAP